MSSMCLHVESWIETIELNQVIEYSSGIFKIEHSQLYGVTNTWFQYSRKYDLDQEWQKSSKLTYSNDSSDFNETKFASAVNHKNVKFAMNWKKCQFSDYLSIHLSLLSKVIRNSG